MFRGRAVPGGGAFRPPAEAVLELLDDLHSADEDTLAVLQYVAPSLPGSGVRIVGAARSDERRPDGLTRLLNGREAAHVAVPRWGAPPGRPGCAWTGCAGMR
ncbi:hypothetical protein [Pseudonocardia sp. NPDC046786]|uniref:hypothetical protein n=1 Tax=Pseudonocardia sp. NPDC046786 TaxID=3155471 RepID=UPI003408C03A